MTARSDIEHEVSQRAGQRCEYCRMHQSLQGATFHVEHIIPRSRNGSSQLDNLAWACPACNLHKSNRVEVQLAGTDEVLRLFNPRLDRWNEHFVWDGYAVRGRTAIGRATVEVLCLNDDRRLRIREAEQWFGLFPP
jgi:hypothetical protein